VGQSVPLDSVQELRVMTSNFTAEYGRAGGGIINIITKSGTNHVHGSLYEFNRVSALSSNTYQNDAFDLPKPAFTRNQFGYSIGGPILKNKLFFFNSTEWIRVRSNATETQSILDPAFLTQPGVSPNTQAFFDAYGSHLRPGIQVLNMTNWGAAQIMSPADRVPPRCRALLRLARPLLIWCLRTPAPALRRIPTRRSPAWIITGPTRPRCTAVMR
jgi:hypothetical protein